MRYICKIDGVAYDVVDLDFTRHVKESKYATIQLKVAGSRLPEIGDAVLIQKETNITTLTKWQGKVNQIRHILVMENGIVEVIAYDLGRKITYLKTDQEGYSNEKGSTIFSSEIDPTSVTDLTPGTVDVTDDILDTVNFGKTISGDRSSLTRDDAFKIIQMISDRDIYVRRDGTTDFLDGAGTDRSASHILQHGINGTLDPALGYIIDETRRVKQVIVKGKGVGVTGNLGSAGSPAAEDKVRQVELPFLQSNDTCNKAAVNLLAELDQVYKYAKFELLDLFTTNYDIFDTVKLKANLPTITVNENLKIYSIHTKVTVNGGTFLETVTLELANFRRGIWADFSNPLDAAKANSKSISFSSISTQAQEHVGAAGGSSTIVEQDQNLSGVDIDTSETDIHTFTTLSATDIAGVHILGMLQITALKNSIQTTFSGLLEIRASDGTDFYPSGSARIIVPFKGNVGDTTDISFNLFIPNNLKEKTIVLKAKVQTAGKITISGRALLYTIAQHEH